MQELRLTRDILNRMPRDGVGSDETNRLHCSGRVKLGGSGGLGHACAQDAVREKF